MSKGAIVVVSNPPFALNAKAGELLWEGELGWGLHEVSGGIMYVVDAIQGGQHSDQQYALSAVDVTAGKTLWRQVHSSVDVAGATDSVVLVKLAGSLRGLDAETGRTLWAYHREGRGLWPHSEGDGVVIVESNRVHSYPSDYEGIKYPVVYPIDEFCLLDMTSGEALWCEQLEEGDDVTRLGDVVYLASGNRGRVLDARTGAEVWSREGEAGMDGDAPQLMRGGGALYVNDHGTISLLESMTGSVRWQYEWEWTDDPSDQRDVLQFW